MSENTRLVRSSTERKICGVCGGLAEYLEVDPVLIRLIFVGLFLTNGVGILAYAVLCILMPEEHDVQAASSNTNGSKTAKQEFEPLGSRGE